MKLFDTYEITEYGVITGPRGKTLKSDKNSSGYERVTLSLEGRPYRYFVHRLVALMFVDGYSPEKVVNHKDGNRLNNHKDNLEWVSPSENVGDGWIRGRKHWNHQTHCAILDLKRQGLRTKEICDKLGVERTMVQKAVRRARDKGLLQ